VAVHRATTAAFFSSGVMGEEAPERLFYGVMLLDVFRTFADANRGRGITDGLDPEVFAAAPEMIAYSFDARSCLERKLSALAAHRSAFGLTQEMLHTPPPQVVGMLRAFRPVFERENYVMGGTRTRVSSWPLGDLFDGVGTTPLAAMVG